MAKTKKESIKTHLIIMSILAFVALISYFFDNPVASFFLNIQNPTLYYLFSFITNPVTLFIILLLFTSFIFYEKNKKQDIIPLWLAVTFTIIVTYYLKFFFERERPVGLVINSLGFIDFSFPSTHVAVAFCVLAITDDAFKSVKWSFLTLAILVTLSRLYFFMHYFSDVAFGAFIGYVIGFLCIELAKTKSVDKWNQKIWN